MDQYKSWLNLLSVAKKGPVTIDPAVRGQAYSHTLSLPGNLTTATLKGEVRANPDSNATLAAFTIGTPVYDGERTRWAYSLSASVTGSLPVDGDGDGVEYFPFDFLLTLSGGDAERLIGGILPLSGHITEPA